MLKVAGFHSELQKARRRHDGLVCLLMPAATAFWCGAGMGKYKTPEAAAQGYSALFCVLPLLCAVLMPITMALLASRLWDIEIRGNTFKLLYTLQERGALFAAKAELGTAEACVTTALALAGVLLVAHGKGCTEALDPARTAYVFVCTLAVNLMLFYGALLVTVLAGLLPALCISVVGSLVGLFTMYLSTPWLRYCIPFSYYIALNAYGMEASEGDPKVYRYFFIGYQFPMLAVTALLGAAAFALALFAAKKKEV